MAEANVLGGEEMKPSMLKLFQTREQTDPPERVEVKLNVSGSKILLFSGKYTELRL